MASADRLIEIFNEAKARPAGAERERFLAESCPDDPELKEQVLSLLQAYDGAGDFLKHTQLISPPALLTEKPGDRIGRYKLLQQIGEGGCGVVYMAEQEEPVRRRVALKVIKLGMDTKSVIARFEAERQALALMDHPNIAKVFDAGATDTGRPYFVMELVRGIKITDYCDQNNLSTEDRLNLFTQVCQAIQHAHQKGIIHRDIKPSNILVTISEPGSPGSPNVIDFGIAKATTDQRLTDKTVFTAFDQFIGTPAYMSPEQAMMTSLDIDTRTDIYALGVLLYELLTGQTPFDAKELMAAGLDAMRRIIREQEPERPSTRLSTLLAADLTTVALHRQAEPARLGTLLRGDLDWIVMKALEKDRARRYETANGLARDIERHLNNEPVVARPPSTGYRFQKLVRRNKLAFTAASAITAALVIGLGISTWMYFKAQGEKKKAQTEAAKATAISDFLQQSLRSANPDQLKGSDYTVRHLLDDFSSGLENQFKDQPEVEAEVRTTLGRAYYRLGLPEKAQPQIKRALLLRRRIFGNQAEQVAATLVDYAWTSFELDQLAKGESQAREALAIYRMRGTAGQPVISALWVLEKSVAAQRRATEVDAIAEEALTIAGKSPGVEFPEMANVIHALAEVKNYQAKYDEGATLASKAVAMHRRLHGAEHPETAWALVSLGVALRGQGKLAESEAASREALRIFGKSYPSGHKTVLAAITELRLVLEARGDFAALEALYGEALAGQRATLGNDSPVVAETMMNLADALQAQGKQTEAEQALREALVIVLRKNGPITPGLPSIVQRQARLLNAQGKAQEGERLFENAIDGARRKLGETNLILGVLLHAYGDFLAAENKLEAAAEYQLQALPILRSNPDNLLAWTLHTTGVELVALGRPQAAEPYYREALAVYRQLHPQADVDGTAWMSLILGDALYQQHKLPEAEQAYRDALAVYTKRQALGSEDGARAVRSLLDVLAEENKLADGEALCRELLARQRAAFTNDDPAVAQRLSHLVGDGLNELGRVDQVEGEQRAAVARYASLKAAAPTNPVYFEEEAFATWMLAEMFEGAGRLDVAEAEYRHAIVLYENANADFPNQAMLTERLARVKGRLGELVRWRVIMREARSMYREAAERGGAPELNEAAWFLATCRDSNARDGTNAVVFAEKAVVATHRKEPNYLDTLAAAYAEVGQFGKATSIQQEAIAVLQNEQEKKHFASRLKLYENDSPSREQPDLAALTAQLTKTLLEENKFTQAEPSARECLAIRERQIPDDWRAFNARSMLGAALLGQKKYAEAGPLLLSGYEGLKQRADNIPAAGKLRLKESLQRLLQLYEATGQSEKAAEWNRKLAEFEQAEAEKKAAAPKP